MQVTILFLQLECSKSQNFFENLEVTQGCLERKTIDEIRIIDEHGVIIIGSRSPNIYHTPSQVIVVEVTSANHPDKKYTFQELQDLISRMVLITGKGKAESQTGLMQKYLEVSMFEIRL